MASVIRDSMAPLIQWVRDLIGDQPGATQQFTNQQIQDRLDGRRADIRYERLEAGPTVVQNAANANKPVVIWADYYSAYKHWETDVVLQGNTPGVGSWLVLNAAASDYITGRFQFSINPFTTDVAPQQLPPVWATGKVYDVYATARDLLRMWVAALMTSTFNFSAGGGVTFSAGQILDNMNKLAQEYDRQAWIGTIEVYRSDLARVDDTSLIIDPMAKSTGPGGI